MTHKSGGLHEDRARARRALLAVLVAGGMLFPAGVLSGSTGSPLWSASMAGPDPARVGGLGAGSPPGPEPLAPPPPPTPTAVPGVPVAYKPFDYQRGGPDGLRPKFDFASTDGDGNDVDYQVQIDNDTDFQSTSLERVSRTAVNFVSDGGAEGGDLSTWTLVSAGNGFPVRHTGPGDIRTGTASFRLGDGTVTGTDAIKQPVNIPLGATAISFQVWYHSVGADASDKLWVQLREKTCTSAMPGGALFNGVPTSNSAWNSGTTTSLDASSTGKETCLYISQVSTAGTASSWYIDDISITATVPIGAFVNTMNGADTAPFTSGQTVRMQPDADLANDTVYWWRTRAVDAGAIWSAWTSPRSLWTDTALSIEAWMQTTKAQFDSATNTLSNARTHPSGGGAVENNTPTATETRSIGSGVSEFLHPFNVEKDYACSAGIYLASELGTAGRVKRLTWYRGSADPTPPTVNTVTVYVSHTTLASWTSTPTCDQTQTGTLVWSGNLGATELPASGTGFGYPSLTLATPFDYDGVRNVVVSVRHQDGSAEPGNACGSQANCWRYTDTATPRFAEGSSATNPPSLNTAQKLPHLQFDIGATLTGQFITPGIKYADGPSTRVSWDRVEWSETEQTGAVVAVAMQKNAAADCTGAWTWATDTSSISPKLVSALGTQGCVRAVVNLSASDVQLARLLDLRVLWEVGPEPIVQGLSIRHAGLDIAYQGNLFANHTNNEFVVTLTDPQGAVDVEIVELKLSGTASHVARWTRSTGLFSEVAGGAEFDILSVPVDAVQSGQQWIIDFKVQFYWNLGFADSVRTPVVFAQDASANPATVSFADLAYQVDNDLVLTGSLAVYPGSSCSGFQFEPGNWSMGSQTYHWCGLDVRYESDLSQAPYDSEFDLRVRDDDGTAWTQPAGSSLAITSTTDAVTDISDIHTLEIVNVPSGGGPHESNTFLIKVDATSPSGSISYTDGYYTVASVSIVHTESDADSGLKKWKIQRRDATLSSGSCLAFGSFLDLAIDVTSPYADSSVMAGNCYQYQLIVYDIAGNSAAFGPGVATAKIDTSAPAVSIDSPAGSSWHGLGTALELDGSDDYAQAADSASLSTSTPFSVEVWFRPDVTGVAQSIVDKKGSSSGYSLVLRADSKLDFNHEGGGNFCEDGPYGAVTAGTWFHLVGTDDGAVSRIYVNGVLLATRSPNVCPTADSNVPLRIGLSQAGTQPFRGLIDEVRVYARALSTTEVADRYSGKLANQDNLAGGWKFDEGIGTVANDFSGSGNSATLFNGAQFSGASFFGTFQVGVSESDSQSGLANCMYAVRSNAVTTLSMTSRPCGGDPDLSVYPGAPFNCRDQGVDKCEFTARAVNGASSGTDALRLFSIDLTRPDTSGLPADAWKRTSFDVTPAGSDSGGSGLAGCEVRVDDLGRSGIEVPWTAVACGSPVSIPVGSTLTCRTQGNDTCQVALRSKDFAGNYDSTPASNSYGIDYTAPTSTFTPGDSWQRDDFTAVPVDSDTGGSGLASCYYSEDDLGRTGEELSGSRGTCNSNGLITVGPVDFCRTQGADMCRLEIWSFDVAGNEATHFIVDFDIDYTAPTLTIDAPTAGTWIGNGTALALDGVDDRVSLAALPTSGSESFTVEAWVRTSLAGTRQSILTWGNLNANGGAWFFVGADNGVHFDLSNSAGPGSTATVTDGAWHHVAVVNNAGSVQIYVDGSASGAPASMSPAIGAGESIIGYGILGWTFPFAGQLDELRVYARVLSSTEISEHSGGVFADSTGLRNLWRFDELPSSGTAADSSGNGNTGTLQNGAGWHTGDVRMSTRTIDVSEFGGPSGLALCEYAVESVGTGFTVSQWKSRTCGTDPHFSVGPGLNCRNQGAGACVLRVRATDGAGNNATANRSLNVDLTRPDTSGLPADGWRSSSFVVSFNASDSGGSTLDTCWRYADDLTLAGVSASWGGLSCATPFTVTVGPSAAICQTQGNDQCRVEIKARDVAGNWDISPQLVDYGIDYTGPTTSITGPADAWKGVDFVTTVLDSDVPADSALSCYWKVTDTVNLDASSGTRGCGGGFTVPVGLADVCDAEGADACKAEAWSVDGAGTESAHSSILYDIDWRAPTNDALVIRHAGAAIADGGKLYAGIEEEFEAKFTDLTANDSLTYVILDFTGADTYQARWTRSTGLFEEIAGGAWFDINTTTSTASLAGLQWTITFRIKLLWGAPWNDTAKDPKLSSSDRAANVDVDTMSANSYVLEDDLEFRETSLVGHWRLDDGTGTTPADSSGLRQTASFAGSPSWTAGKLGNALSFSGSGQYLTVPDSAALSFTGPFTLAAWIRTNSPATQQGVIEKYLSNVDGYALRIQTGGTLQIYSMGPASWASANGATVLSSATWYHVAAVFDGTALRLYLNGVPDGSAATTIAPGDGTGSMKIGGRGDDGSNAFNGLLDEARVYGRALSPEEISDLANLKNNDDATGMIAAYHLDEQSGSSPPDFSGLGDPLCFGEIDTCTGTGPVWTSAGKYGRGLQFDGLNDFTRLTNLKVNTASGGYNTVEFWMNWDGGSGVSGSGMMPFGWNTSNGGTTNLWINAGCLGFNAWQGGYEGIPFPAGTYANTWVHIAAAFYNSPGGADAMGNMKLYVNGAQQSISNATPCAEAPYTNARSATTVARFGHSEHHDSGKEYFGGRLDELRIYNYEVPSSLIAQHAMGAHYGGLRAVSDLNGARQSGSGWIKGGQNVAWSGLTAYYQGTMVTPLDTDFDLKVANDNPTAFIQGTGAALARSSSIDAADDASDIHSIAVANALGGGPHDFRGFELKIDSTPPAATISYTNGWFSSTTVPVTHTKSDVPSGIASTTLERRSSALSSGVCTGFGGWSTLVTDPATSYDDTSVVQANCYEYRLVVVDKAGWSTTASTGGIARIDTSGPSLSINSPAAGTWLGPGHSVTLDGSGGTYLSTGFDPSEGTSWSAEAWVDIASSANEKMLFGMSPYPAGPCSWAGMWLEVTGTSLRAYLNDCATTTDHSAGSVAVGVWTHVAFVRSGSTLKFFINGAVVGNFPSIPTGDTGAQSAAMTLGSIGPNSVGSWIFNGMIDEARFYYRALGDTEVAEHYSGTYADNSNLMGRWRFNEGTGSTAADSSGNGFTATFNGGARWAQDQPVQSVDLDITESDPEAGLVNCGYATEDAGAGYTVAQWKPRPCGADPEFSAGASKNCRAQGANTCAIWVRTPAGSGQVASNSRVFSIDYTLPSASISYAAGYVTVTSVSITHTKSDAHSGVGVWKIQRRSATLSGGTCGGFGAWGDLVSSPASPYADSSVATGNCYEYRFYVQDVAGNYLVTSPGGVVKVDPVLPTATVNVAAYSYASNPGNTVDVDFADAHAGLQEIKYRFEQGADASQYYFLQQSMGGATSYNSNFNIWSNAPVGASTVRLRALDQAGNVVEATVSYEVVAASDSVTLYPGSNYIAWDDTWTTLYGSMTLIQLGKHIKNVTGKVASKLAIWRSSPPAWLEVTGNGTTYFGTDQQIKDGFGVLVIMESAASPSVTFPMSGRAITSPIGYSLPNGVHMISIPEKTGGGTYFAKALADSMSASGGSGCSTATNRCVYRISRLDPVTQTVSSVSWSTTLGQWTGTDFEMLPGYAYFAYIRGLPGPTVVWTP